MIKIRGLKIPNVSKSLKQLNSQDTTWSAVKLGLFKTV